MVQEFAGTCGANPLENQDGFLNGRNHFFFFCLLRNTQFLQGGGEDGKECILPIS